MDLLIIISQTLLYLSFSYLVGSFILLLAPKEYRPDINIPKRILLFSAMMLPVFAFVPVLDIILFLAPRLGFFDSLKMVLTTYTVGTAWNFTLLGSLLLGLLIAFTKAIEKTGFALLGLCLTFGVVLSVAWSSHAGALDPSIGIISDYIHLVAVSLWVGIVLIIGWFSTNHNNWIAFLNWFSVVAIGSLVATVLSGIFMMEVIMDGYIDSWMVSYGQGILVKHLFLLPLLFYALVNGFIVKYKLTNDVTFNPIPWVRVESLILFAIFTITAIYSQQPPPHGFLTNDAVSPLFRLFHDDDIDVGSTIGFALNGYTIGFFFTAIVFFALMVVSFVKRASIILSLLISLLFVTSIYCMTMVTVIIR